jgi:Leucine-rich repeat (LRR) protein
MFSINTLERLNTIKEKDYGFINIINIRGCDCKTFPNVIFEFFNLESLDISYNGIDVLPDNFDKLTNLQEVIFDNNDIIELPKSLKQCKKLVYISINKTKISILPKWLGKLNLESLELGDNEIESINFDITKISDVYIYYKSYKNLYNLSENCEYVQINELSKSVLNLPITLKKLKLLRPKHPTDVKVPFGCEFIIE